MSASMVGSVLAPAPPRLALSLAGIRTVLRDTLLSPRDEPGNGRVAAVAAILRENGGEVELLFIRRATRRGDPWSGHMAWPGGKREAGDASLLACAVRETREEIGLDLQAQGELIGTLREWRHEGTRPTRLRGVFPFVFALAGPAPGGLPVAQLLQAEEVQEAVWIPLSYFTTWRSRRPWCWAWRLLPAVPPAFRYEGRVIWGLTQWMLADLLARVSRVKA